MICWPIAWLFQTCFRLYHVCRFSTGFILLSLVCINFFNFFKEFQKTLHVPDNRTNLLAPVYEKFFEGHEGCYSTYLQSHPSFNESNPETSIFRPQILSKIASLCRCSRSAWDDHFHSCSNICFIRWRLLQAVENQKNGTKKVASTRF